MSSEATRTDVVPAPRSGRPDTIDPDAPAAAPPPRSASDPADPDGPSGAAPRTRGWRSWDVAVLAAVGVWLVGTVLALAVPHAFTFNYYSVKGWSAPLGLGVAGGAAILLIIGVRHRAPTWLAGASAGFFGAWVSLMLATALRGTPFPFYGLSGDSGRLTALATRYSSTWATVDAWIPGVQSEYPPLFPWLVGRTAALIDVPAWRLVGQFEAVTMGLAILVGFLMWRRLVPDWVALAVTVFGFMAFPVAPKSYEVITLLVFVPWVLGTFGRPSRGRLHWLSAGMVGGLLVLTYYGWMVFGVFGVLAIAVATWRAETDRRAYLIYLGKVVLVAAVLASWFVGPYAYASLTIGGDSVSDLYGSSSLLDNMFPFLGANPLAVVQLTGLVGLVFFLRSRWWAGPLLTLVVGAYVFRAVGAIAFALTQHTWMAHYTQNLYGAVLVMAGILTLVDAVPKLLGRLSISAPQGGVVIAMSFALVWAGYTYMMSAMPNTGGPYSGQAELAFLEPLPDGSRVVDVRNRTPTPWFPVTPIQQDVEKVLGPNPQGIVLSADERIFSFLPWHGYTGNDLGGALARTFERQAEIRKLEKTVDPAAFLTASARTAYGPIDIFILHKQDGAWQWTAHMGFGQPDTVVSFQPSQFDPQHWVIDDALPNDYVVAIRRP